MKRENIFKIFLIGICISFNALAIAPAKKGVKVPANLENEFKQIRQEYSSGYWAQEISKRIKIRELAKGTMSSSQMVTDTVRIPVLLGYYTNSHSRYSKQDLQTNLFDGPNPTGTITDFYLENSYGQMYLTGGTSEWNMLPNNTLYYAGTDGLSSNGVRDFVIDLIMATDNSFDFSPFIDKNSLDGEGYHVRFLGAVHSGAGAEAGAANIWSHRWRIKDRLLVRKNDPNEMIVVKANVLSSGHYRTNDLYNGLPVIIDGDYACEPELSGASNTSGPIIEIGVFCHEFGHIFGLPDLYDTDNSSEGIGNWCLMASGSWGGDGQTPETPTHMSAWCKISMGWVTPTVVQGYLPFQSIRRAESYPEVFKLWKQGLQGSQYFLIENREKIGFDLKLPQSGLLIFHIDDTQPNNDNENQYHVDLEQADGLRQMNTTATNRGDAGDPFPGANNNRQFDGYTIPNSKDYNNAQTYVGVRNISVAGDTMYADLDVGTRPFLRVTQIKQVDSGQSNVNGRIEPGEIGQLILKIENVHPTAANTASVSIQGAGAGLIVEATSTLFSLSSLTSKEITTTAHITVESGFVPREVPFQVNVETENFQEIYPFTLTLGYPSLLLLDGDSIAQTSLQYLRSSLDTLGRYYEVQRARDSLTMDATLSKRSTIVYLSGSKKSETITNKVLDSLVGYLQNGGRLLLSGQNIAEDLQRRGVSVLSDVFHVRWSKNLAIGKYAYGVPSDPLGVNIAMLSLAGGDGASNQTSLDILLADGISVPCLTYSSVGGTNIAGLHVENQQANSKLVFLGFGLEAINNLSSTTSRSTVLQNIMNWFTTPVGVAEKGIAMPHRWILEPVYPNPFNPTGRIVYEVGKIGKVEIAIYNIIGQRVQTLVSAEKAAGRYEVVIDGSRFSSGIYFCRMTADDFQATQKFSLIK